MTAKTTIALAAKLLSFATAASSKNTVLEAFIGKPVSVIITICNAHVKM